MKLQRHWPLLQLQKDLIVKGYKNYYKKLLILFISDYSCSFFVLIELSIDSIGNIILALVNIGRIYFHPIKYYILVKGPSYRRSFESFIRWYQFSAILKRKFSTGRSTITFFIFLSSIISASYYITSSGMLSVA